MWARAPSNLQVTRTLLCALAVVALSTLLAASRPLKQSPFISGIVQHSTRPVDPLSEVGPSALRAFGHQSRLSNAGMEAADEPAIGQADSANKPRRGYEVNRPTRVLPERDHLTSCSVELLKHTFETSYGQPAIAKYSPDLITDPNCKDPNRWVFVELDLYGYAKGRQFDRLASIQLDGVEVLRHDNQEPSANGTVWQTSKEVNKYFDLFRTERTLLFDFPNLVNDIYTAPLEMTLAMTVYVAANDACPLKPLAEDYARIFPLSKRTLDANAFFEIGDDFDAKETVGNTRLTLPHNARSALVEIYASGTAKDEFWYTNIPNKDFDKIGGEQAGVAYPRGPLREIQLLIDGKLAGIVQPFPVVFTGGISPFLWRPQVAYGAFDQPTYLIDITPFLGTLTDEQEHEFGLKVVSAEQNQTVLAWFVTGNVQVQLDSSDERTMGELTLHEESGKYLQVGVVQGDLSKDGSAHVEVRSATPRTLRVHGTLKPGSSAEPYDVTVDQLMTFSSVNDYASSSSSTVQQASGSLASRHNGQSFLSYTFDFPFTLTGTQNRSDLDHRYRLDLSLSQEAASTFKEPTSQTIDMVQKAQAESIITGNPPQLVGGSGNTSAVYDYKDSDRFTFYRDNRVSNQSVTHDEVKGTLAARAAPIM